MDNQEDNPKENYRGINLSFIAVSFWAGAAVMAFELVGVRLLTPFFGMGIQIWTIAITVSLAALAVGYWLGGKVIDIRPSVITIAIILFLAAVSLVFVRIFGGYIPIVFGSMSLVTGALCSGIFIMFVPLILLGAIQPVLARLMVGTVTRAGTVVGGLMAAGTIGGIIGTAITGLFFIPYLGLSKTLLVLALGTFIIAAVVFGSASKWIVVLVVIFFGLLYISSEWIVNPSKKPSGEMSILEEVESLYGRLEILEHNGTLALVCNGIFQTVQPALPFGIVKGTLIRGRDFIELIPYFRPNAKTGLLIGVGAGLHSRALSLYGIDIQGVEIDPVVIELGEKYFDMGTEINIADGRAFLLRDKQQYDTIILDAFLGGTVPEHLYTKEFFELVNKHLNTNGIFAVRLIGYPEHSAIQAITRTIQEIFPFITSIQSGIANELQHVFVFASSTALDLGNIQRYELNNYGFTGDEFCEIDMKNSVLLTDDKSNLALLSDEIVAVHRRNSVKLRKEPLW